MIQRSFAAVILAFALCVGLTGNVARAASPSALLLGPEAFAAQDAADSGPEASAPVTQPSTTQPTAAANSAAAPDLSASAALGNTKLGQLFLGKKTLTPREAIQLEFWLSAGKDLLITAVGFIPRLFVATLFLVIFWVIHRALRRVVVGGMHKASVDQSICDMLGHVIKWGVMGFGLVIAFNQVGIQIAALLTGVSIIGLAIGFAAQETLANFIAGVVIFWDKPFKVGDWIDVEGVFARVLRITFRSTRMLNLDGEIVILPNTKMLANKVVNHTTNPINRVNVSINIPARSSIEEARAVMLNLTTGDKRIVNDPPPAVVVNDCVADATNLVLRFWIRDESLERGMRCEYLEKAKNALEAAELLTPLLALVPAPTPTPMKAAS